jgi:hypothetical protein
VNEQTTSQPAVIPETINLNDLNDLRRRVLAGDLKMTAELSRQIVAQIRRNRNIDVVEGQAMPAKRGAKTAKPVVDLDASLDALFAKKEG